MCVIVIVSIIHFLSIVPSSAYILWAYKLYDTTNTSYNLEVIGGIDYSDHLLILYIIQVNDSDPAILYRRYYKEK